MLAGVIGVLVDLFGRVAKCHGYGGYIRVKKLEGWGKIAFLRVKFGMNDLLCVKDLTFCNSANVM